MKDLNIVYCKNCKHFNLTKLKYNNLLYECRKNKNVFDLEEPELYCHKQCYTPKIFK